MSLAFAPPQSPGELVVAHQRDRILAAAIGLFAERGFAETTLSQITKRAQIAWPTLYRCFASKEEIYLVAFDRSVRLATERLAGVASADYVWADRTSAAVETLVGSIAGDPARGTLCLVEFRAAGLPAYERYQAVTDQLASALREGRELDPDLRRPDGLEEMIVGGLAWLIESALRANDIARLRLLIPEMIQLALAPYVGDEEAVRRALAARTRGDDA
jgi:AcrR family transcriptional regulator